VKVKANVSTIDSMNISSDDYFSLIVETYDGRKGSNSYIRVRPLAGQGLPTGMNVECSKKMREQYPVGTKFLIRGKVTQVKGSEPFIYSYYKSGYETLTDKKALKWIHSMYS
jgi:hypothetical protein